MARSGPPKLGVPTRMQAERDPLNLIRFVPV